MTHDSKIVRDEQVGDAETVLKFGKQVQDAGLNRDIKGRDRLVEYKQFRFRRQCPGYTHPLALTAGELVRIALAKDRVEMHKIEQFRDLRARSLEPNIEKPEWLGDDLLDGHPGMKGGERVLEYHLQMAA